jgi:hypothetical protein
MRLDGKAMMVWERQLTEGIGNYYKTLGKI